MSKEILLNTAGLKFEYNKLASKYRCCGHDVSGFASRFASALQSRPFSYGTTGAGTALGQAVGAINFAYDQKNAGISMGMDERRQMLALQNPITKSRSRWNKAHTVVDDQKSNKRSDPKFSSAYDEDEKERTFFADDQNAINKIYTGGSGAVYYDPGPRVYEAIKKGYQMMDMYYGNNSEFWKGRDELIAHFIHHALKVPGPFDKEVSGRKSYLEGYKTTVEGWAPLDNKWGNGVPFTKYRCTSDPTTPKYSSSGCTEALDWYTHTAAMSWVVRRMVQIWGGKIVYDGKAVTFSGIFENPPDPRDSNIEALDLLQYVGDGSGKMGNAKVEFHYGGVQTRPTKTLFLKHWNWSAKDPAVPIDPKRLLVQRGYFWGQTIEILKQNSSDRQPLIDLWDRFHM